MKQMVSTFMHEGVAALFALVLTGSCMAAENGPIDWWKFDEGTGSIARDSSGRGGDCDIHGAAWTDGKTGKALEFDGRDNYLEARNPGTGDIKGAFTISFWMNPSEWVGQYSACVVSKKASEDEHGYVIYGDGTIPSKINLRVGGTKGGYGFLPSASDVEEDVWQYWAVTYDPLAQTLVWYKNGKLDKEYESISIGDMSNDAKLHIGHAQTWNCYFVGLLDEIKISSRALSADEIRSEYQSGGPITETAAVAPSFAVKWRVIPTKYPTSDVAIAGCTVRDAGATGDGVSDDTAAFRAAMNTMAQAGGGTVFVPEGRYAIKGNLRVPTGVTLRGEWEKPDGTQRMRGTILMAYSGRGKKGGRSFISLMKGSGIRDLAVWYPEQDAKNIVAYPFCVKQLAGDNATVQNVTLVNPFQGIIIGKGSELHYLHEIYGSPLAIGLEVDFVSDSGRADNIHFNPDIWSNSGLPGAPSNNGAHASWMKEHGIGLLYLRYEWIYSAFVTISGYDTGLKVVNSPLFGENNGQIYRNSITNCNTAVNIIDANFAGISFTESLLEGRDYGVVTSESFNSRLLFHTCDIRGNKKAAVLDGIQNQAVLFRHCSFSGEVERKSGDLLIADCTMKSAGDHIRLGENVNAATIAGNRFNGSPRIVNKSNSDRIQVSQEPFPASNMPNFPPLVDKELKPDKSDLFVVTDAQWGAKKDATGDDTGAIQRALDAAKRNGGGIVFLPGGEYCVRGSLTVPSGVELRGVYDVPHHPLCKGSVVRVYAGRNDETASPFIVMKERSGMRGLTFIYPEQKFDAIVPYPFLAQGRGKDIYIVNITAMNPYKMLDFKSYRCDNYSLLYPSGAPLSVGIAVGGGSVGGELLNTQFNAHYWNRSPYPDCPGSRNGDKTNAVWDFQHEHLNAFVFGDCKNEILYQNCVFGSRHGLHFVPENGTGASHCLILGHGIDGTRIPMVFDGLAPDGVDLINSQIVSMNWSNPRPVRDKHYFDCGANLHATARLYNTTLWGLGTSACSAILHDGTLFIDLASFFQYGSFLVDGGKLDLSSTYLVNCNTTGPEIIVRDKGRVALTANMSPWGMRVNRDAPRSAVTKRLDNQRNFAVSADAREVSVTLGKTQKKRGLSLREKDAESENVPVEKAGRAAWMSVKKVSPDCHMMSFEVELPEFKYGSVPGATISIDYFDEGTGQFRIFYDSSDKSCKRMPQVPGAWKIAAEFNLTNTGTWKTFQSTVNDAFFGSRCNDADMRFDIMSGDTQPAIAAVRIAAIGKHTDPQ